MPEPSCVRRAGALDAMEALEQAWDLLRRECRRRVSRTLQLDARSCRSRSDRWTDPSNVNFSAFESRLRTIFSHISRST